MGERTASRISASDSQLGIDYRVEPSRSLGGADGEESPFARDALQLVRPVLDEVEARSGDQVADRARDDHLPGPGQGRDPCTDADRDPGHLLLMELALTRMHTDPNVEP